MMRLFLYSLLLILVACGRPDIKSPEDILARDTKAAICISSLADVFNLLPDEYQKFSYMLKAAINDSKPMALVLTSLDPVEAYLAIPANEGQEEQLKTFISNNIYYESESWSGYVFVSLRGSLPSSFGNKDFLPEDKGTVINARALIDKLSEGNDAKLESLKNYKTLRAFRGLSASVNKILTRFITHDLVDFLKQAEEFRLTVDANGLAMQLSFPSSSEIAEHLSILKVFELPILAQRKDSDCELAATLDFSKLKFPLNGVEIGLKSWLADMNKTEAVFPMDTVFKKLRESGMIQASGAFSIKDSELSGEMFVQAEQGAKFYESVSSFYEKTSPLFAKTYSIKQNENIFEAELKPPAIPGNNFGTDFKLKVDENHLLLLSSEKEKPSFQFLESDEKGLMKIILNSDRFLPFGSDMKSLEMKLWAEEDILKFKADIKK